jgi:hypothetical protein
MRGKLGLVMEFVLISVSATFVVHAAGVSAAAPEPQAPLPTAAQIEAAVAHADAQALAVNGRR